MTTEFLTLKHYKEPLLPVPESEGFGFYGAIQVTLDGEKMQCHICGNLYCAVGVHAFSKHRLPAVQYKEKYQLASTTALVSEAERERQKQRTLNWIASVSPSELLDFRRKAVEIGRRGQLLRRQGQKQESLESKNKKGTCPQQLLQKILEVKKELDHQNHD